VILCPERSRSSEQHCHSEHELQVVGGGPSKYSVVVSSRACWIVVVHVDRVFGSAVNDVADTQALSQDPVMIAHIVDDEDTLAILVAGGDEATRSAGGPSAENLGRRDSDREAFLQILWTPLFPTKVDAGVLHSPFGH